MNAVLYKFIKHKKINGTLFYCFEYFNLIKRNIQNVKFIIFGCSEEDLNFIKEVFIDKYTFPNEYLNDIIIINKYSDLYNLKINTALTLDIRTYDELKIFLKNTHVYAYSNDTHHFLNKNEKHIFYGWYDYQKFNYKTRLKIYKDIHKTFEQKGDKILLTSLSGDNVKIAKELNLDENKVLLKQLTHHHKNLFKEINTLIYWHTGQLDRNNRSLIESQIHNIELKVYFNGHYDDSINERYLDIINNNIDDYFLRDDDILIKDFLNGSK